VHAGNLGFYGAWQTLISAVRILEKDGVGLVFIGEGAMKPQVEAMAEDAARFASCRFGLRVKCRWSFLLVTCTSLLSRKDSRALWCRANCIDTCRGRPVLGVAPEESDIVRIVRRSGCGIAADPDDPASVVEAVRRVLHDSEQLQAMARRSREISFSYDRVKQLKIFSETIEEVVRE